MNLEEIIKEWLTQGENQIIITHGGDGGRFYVRKDADGESIGDGVGDTITQALENAFLGSH